MKVEGFLPKIMYTITSKGGGKKGRIRVKYNIYISCKKGSRERANRVKSVHCGRTRREWRNVLGA